MHQCWDPNVFQESIRFPSTHGSNLPMRHPLYYYMRGCTNAEAMTLVSAGVHIAILQGNKKLIIEKLSSNGTAIQSPKDWAPTRASELQLA